MLFFLSIHSFFFRLTLLARVYVTYGGEQLIECHDYFYYYSRPASGQWTIFSLVFLFSNVRYLLLESPSLRVAIIRFLFLLRRSTVMLRAIKVNLHNTWITVCWSLPLDVRTWTSLRNVLSKRYNIYLQGRPYSIDGKSW